MNRVAISVLYLLEVYLLEIKCRNHWVMGEGRKKSSFRIDLARFVDKTRLVKVTFKAGSNDEG